MNWLELTITATEQNVPEIEDILLELGAQAVTLKNAGDRQLFEPAPGEIPLWEQVFVTGLFPTTIDVKALETAINTHLQFPYRLDPLEEKDWVRACLADWKPLQFGRRLWICPTTGDLPIEAQQNIVLRLDPGLAFGTGSHPTTALCLEWLDGAELQNETVLDYGCGSGILALASKLLGASIVYAVDIDPQATYATRRNAEETGLLVETASPQELQANQQFSIVLANILARPLIMLAPLLAIHCKCDGHLVLAGLLDEQADEVEAAFTPWFQFLPRTSREGWCRLVGRRVCP